MEEERIQLPTGLGIQIAKLIGEKTGKPHINKTGMLDLTFTREELESIKVLRINEPYAGVLEGISMLPNLQVLEVSQERETDYQHPRDIKSISESDLKEISKCEGLKSLYIINQANIGWLDVSDLKGLQVLKVSHNPNLDSIEGLENLQELFALECYGNKRLQQIDGLDGFITQMPEGSRIDLDVLLFPNAIGYNHLDGSINEKAFERIQDNYQLNCSWSEGLTGNRDIKINTFQMMQMHKKACEILEQHIPEQMMHSPTDIIVGIEEYLSRNVKYSYDDKGNVAHSVKKNGIVSGPQTGANGAYMALTQNIAVCQGYTRAMQYLLKLKGIESHDASCIANESKKTPNMNSAFFTLPEDGYHSIICIDGYYGLYDDPCWNAGRYQRGSDKSLPYTLMTKDEISETHAFYFGELNVSNSHLGSQRKNVDTAMKRYEYYMQKKEAQESRHTKSTQVLGQESLDAQNNTKEKDAAQQVMEQQEKEIRDSKDNTQSL